MSVLSDTVRFWPYGLAFLAGAGFSVIDRRVFGRMVFAVLLTIVTIAGAIGTRGTQFTWQGGKASYPFNISILALLFGFSALAGYAAAAVAIRGKGKGAA